MTQSPCLPELPKPTKVFGPLGYREVFFKDDMNTHFLKGYEAGSAAAAQAAWQVPDEILPALDAECHALTAAYMRGHADALEQIRMHSLASTQGAEGAAPQAVVGEAKPVPLTEPVTVAKAMLAHRQAEVWLSEGTGPVCCVGMVNIQVTPWHRHTPSEAKAFAEGFNLAAKWMRNAVTSPTPTAPQAAYPGGSAPGYEEKRPVIERSECALAGGSCNCDPDTVFCPVHNGRAVYAKPATPTAPQVADALREALKGTVAAIEGMHGRKPEHVEAALANAKHALLAAPAQHQPQQGEQHGK